MKTKALITASSFLFFIFSCKKENIDFDYGATYYKSSIQQHGLLRYFTTTGEITNSPAINNYFDDDTSYFGYLRQYLMQPGYYDTLIVSSPNEVIDDTYNWRIRYPAKLDGRRLIMTRDSLTRYSSGDEYTRSPGYYLLHYKPKVYYEWLQSSLRGDYLFGFRGEAKNVVTTDGVKLIFPLIFSRQHRNGKFPNADYSNNYIAKDFFKSIIPGDTLSVLELRVYYDKK